MNDSQKIVWAEGVFLGQQHFQLFERNIEHNHSLRARALAPFSWGFLSLTIDEEALANAHFRLLECDAIFPNGRVVCLRDGAQNLAIELFRELGEPTGVLGLYLGLPTSDAVDGVAGYSRTAEQTGWAAAFEQIADEHDPARVREVMVARPKLEILTEHDSKDNYSLLKLCELVPEGDGRWRQASGFVPTVVRIGTSPVLMSILARIQELAQARARILSERREGLTRIGELGSPDLTQFLLLQALRPAITALQHLRSQPALSPERLYCELASLAASLQGFAAPGRDNVIPGYEHTNLGRTFGELAELLQYQLGDLAGMPVSAFKFHKETDAIHNLETVDDRLLQSNGIYLAVQHQADAGWVTEFTRQAKVGAREDIELIVGNALPGVALTHSQRPPTRLPIKSGYEYFRVETHGDFWERVREHRTLALYLPHTFKDVRVELVTVE